MQRSQAGSIAITTTVTQRSASARTEQQDGRSVVVEMLAFPALPSDLQSESWIFIQPQGRL
jgi:hypothetical protein